MINGKGKAGNGAVQWPPVPKERHAVVMGGSMAGLFAGRVLANYFDRVTIVERDRYPDSPAHRKGVPQALHLHNMVNQGWAVMENLFPNLGDDLVQSGATIIEWPADLRWLGRTGWSPRFHAGIRTYSCKRDLLEWHVQRRMAAHPRITMVQETRATSLIWDADGRRVLGVRVSSAKEGAQEGQDEREIAADLVVDASGRSSQLPQWLQQHGYKAPREEIIKAYVGYSTRYFKQPAGAPPPDWKVLLEQSRPPHLNRAAGLFQVENGQWVLTLVGMGSDNYPPTDEAGFMEFMRTLPSMELYDFISSAVPDSPIYGYRVPQNRLFHFEELPRWPEHLVVLGDAVCLFNPVYGHGISVIAQSVVALEQTLHQQKIYYPDGDMSGMGRRFQKRLAKVLSVPWMFTAGEDLRYPTTEGGKRDLMTSMLHWYIDGVMMYAISNPKAHRTLIQVMHLIEPPTAFLNPEIALNALRLNVQHVLPRFG